MSVSPHPKYFSKGEIMPSQPSIEDIQKQLETLMLTAMLNVIKRLTDELSALKKERQMKF
jgi:hypothetical protein